MKIDKRMILVQHEFDNEPSYLVDQDTGHTEDALACVPAGGHRFASELAKRWNVHRALVRQLDCLLVQFEDSGTITDADLGEARDLLVRIGFDEKTLGELADTPEN